MSRGIAEATQLAHKAVEFDRAGNLVEAARCYEVFLCSSTLEFPSLTSNVRIVY